MQIALYNWDALYERAMDKVFGSEELRAKDEARAWFETKYPLAEQDNIEEAIDGICESESSEPFFDRFGNYVCSIGKGTYWRY